MRIVIPQLSKILDSGQEPVNLLSFLVKNQIPIARSCGGDGVCGTCQIFIESDDELEWSDEEQRLFEKQKISRSPVHSSAALHFACLVWLPANSSKTWVLRCHYW